MSSSSSVLRLKDRGGASAVPKIAAPKPSKPLTPATGKENPKQAPQVSAQKPAIPTGSAARFSAVLEPRGRSISPFARSSSAGKRERAPARVSLDGRDPEKENRLLRSRSALKSGSRVLRKSGACQESEAKVRNLGGLGAYSIGRSNNNVGALVNSSERSCFSLIKEVKDGIAAKKSEDRLITQEKPSLASFRVSEKSKAKVSSSECVKSEANGKYQGRLQEKLAFLEGKVKRIASDIKRTKEMLDLNNPDGSKVLLSDIQEKISSIEKAIGHSVDSSGAENGATQESINDARESKKTRENFEAEVGNNLKSSVKDLSNEELEARLFPHHKLLKNRTIKVAMVEEKVELKVEAKPSNLVNGNPTSAEFLSALPIEDQCKATVRDKPCEAEVQDVQDMDIVSASKAEDKAFEQKDGPEVVLTTEETLDELDDQENKELIIGEMNEEMCDYKLNEIGCKAATGGWFVSEGEAALLVHSDGSCSYYDVANGEVKAEYKPSGPVSPNIWRDCWIVRAPGADGCSGRYVVAASAGNSLESGFCSWEFYSKDVTAFHIEDSRPASRRTVLGPLPTNTSYRRNVLSNIAVVPENREWWYRPSGPLIMSVASYQTGVRVYDIRDGEQIMKWEMQKPAAAMAYSSPVQWRSRGKVVLAEGEGVSLWDVNSLHPQLLLSVGSSSERAISALHVNNTDAEVGGGVRQRISSSEAEGNDGVFCTQDSIEVLDFRNPSGVGLKIKNPGLISADSVFSRGDNIFVGCISSKPGLKMLGSTQLQQFSIRKQALMSTYALPDESNTHSSHSAITQVWGNSNLTMGVNGLGLFVFDTVKEDVLQLFSSVDCHGQSPKVKEVIGPDDLYCPSFDYTSSRALLISRDRPAAWRYLF